MNTIPNPTTHATRLFFTRDHVGELTAHVRLLMHSLLYLRVLRFVSGQHIFPCSLKRPCFLCV